MDYPKFIVSNQKEEPISTQTQSILLNETTVRTLVKSEQQKFNFLFSHPKHMLWVLKWTVSLRRFFCTPKKYIKTDGLENIHNFTLKIFVYLKLC